MNNKLYFYGGLDTSGGVHVIYRQDNIGLLFDAGISHSGLFRAPFIHLDDPLKPTPGLEMEQYLLSKMAPPILDLYDEAAIKHITEDDLFSLWETDHFPAFEKMYVFISHMHQDHMALLPFLSEKITVFMHEQSYLTYQGMIEANYYMDTKANIITFNSGEEIPLEGFSLQTMEVDHNILGASGFILHSDEEKIAFTADWRKNGRHPQKMDQFISTCQETSVDLLLTETTKVSPQTLHANTSSKLELEVMKQLEELLAKQQGLSYLLALPLDVERMAEVIQIADRQEKKLILDAQIAKFWHRIRQDTSLLQGLDNFSAVEERVIRILSHPPIQVESLPFQQLTLGEVVTNKKQFIFHLTFTSLPLLIEMERLGEKATSSIFIHANSPADHHLLETWLDTLNIRYCNIGNPGHASSQNILQMIEEVNPKVVIPVHGKYAHLLKSVRDNVYLPAYGEEVVIQNMLQETIKIEGSIS